MKIATVLDQIDLGSMALPEFQRGYVWNRDQVRSLMYSLYRKHPVGSLLVWVTKTERAHARGDAQLTPGSVKLLLDGQQRITSLYGMVRGKPPEFFDGSMQAFTGLYFDLENEVFEFYAPQKMRDHPLWINVTDLMKSGVAPMIQKIVTVPEFQPKVSTYINRLNAVDTIKEIDLHVEEVVGEDKTVDVVVDIFNRVNSGGTKLSQGDLALAKICAEWPAARKAMKQRLDKWRHAGFNFRLEWLLRNINTIVTGEALFSALKNIDTATFQKGLEQAEKQVDRLLNMIAGRLGLDHDRVLGSRYSFPVMTRYLAQRGGKLSDQQERDQLLYWYINTFLWGRFSGTTETVINKDLALIEGSTDQDTGQGLDRLIQALRQNRGDLRLDQKDFLGTNKGSRFYPLLYLLTRVCHARDWGTGIELAGHLLGQLNSLQIHHIFPKSLLYKHGYKKAEVNAIANFTFLTQETNLQVSNRNPAEYIPEHENKYLGAVASHWIPMEPKLWQVENYMDFLVARRQLLAEAANGFLDSLLAGAVPEPKIEGSIVDRVHAEPPGVIEDEDEERILRKCNEWVVKHGLPSGELMHELIDPQSDEVLAALDLAWPSGLQEGFSQPVAVLIDEGQEIEEIANQAGYRFFTSVKSFREYVRREILASAEADE